MSQHVQSFAERYGAALDVYLAEPSDASLSLARELGEHAVATGVGLAELASIHAEELRRWSAGSSEEPHAVVRAWPFLIETLRTFETELATQESQRYRAMFDDNPIPMWIYDRETLGF